MEYTGFGFGGFDIDARAVKKQFGNSGVSLSSYVDNYEIREIPEKHDTDLSTMIGTMRLKIGEPNSELREHHITRAKLAHAASEYFNNGMTEAQNFLRVNGINKQIVSANRYGVLLKDNETGLFTVSLRGMKSTDFRDIMNVSGQTFGKHESLDYARKLYDSADGQVEHIVGYSMGGSDALDLATEKNIQATIFDPPINPRHVLRNMRNTGLTNDIEIIRNPENFLSVGASFRNLSFKPLFRVTVVPTGKSGYINSHELLPNFAESQINGARSEVEMLLETSNKFAQHDTLISMKKAMIKGESFTQFYRKLNSRNGQPSGVDVDVDGIYDKLGPRINRNAPLTRLWRLIGGDFNYSERKHVYHVDRNPHDIVRAQARKRAPRNPTSLESLEALESLYDDYEPEKKKTRLNYNMTRMY